MWTLARFVCWVVDRPFWRDTPWLGKDGEVYPMFGWSVRRRMSDNWYRSAYCRAYFASDYYKSLEKK